MNNIPVFVEPNANKLQLNRGAALTDMHPLENLEFYIPQNYIKEGMSIYLILQQNSGARDVVELTRTGSFKSVKNYYTYKMAVTQAVKIQSGMTSISLMILDLNNIVTIFDPIILKLDILQYQFTHQIALLRNLNISVSDHYEKIVQLLMKLVEKGETNYDSKDDCGSSAEIS